MPSTENVGSRARDHLANERTFLAWVRTALGLIGLGVLTAKLVETEGLRAEAAGLLLIAFGGGVLVYGLARYRRVAGLLEQGLYQAADRGPAVVTVLTLAVAAAAVVLLFP